MPRGFLVKRLYNSDDDLGSTVISATTWIPTTSPATVTSPWIPSSPSLTLQHLPFNLPVLLHHNRIPSPPQTAGLDLSLKSSSSCQSTPTLKTPSSNASTKKRDRTPSTTPSKRSKVIRRLQFDDEESISPVSGTIIIRELPPGEEIPNPDDEDGSGDIDPAHNVVQATPEALATLAKIENRLGDYVCRLCRRIFEDAFGLARHRCSRIRHVEYRCPECGKLFGCPANLASHRRWHRPRDGTNTTRNKNIKKESIEQIPKTMDSLAVNLSVTRDRHHSTESYTPSPSSSPSPTPSYGHPLSLTLPSLGLTIHPPTQATAAH